jgi:hypothetical protein
LPDGGQTGGPDGCQMGARWVPDGGPDELRDGGQMGCPTGARRDARWGLDEVADGRIVYF